MVKIMEVINMKKTYTLQDNQFIIYPNTDKERNITEECAECRYCIRKPRSTCGHYNPEVDFPACDWFTFSKEWEEV